MAGNPGQVARDLFVVRLFPLERARLLKIQPGQLFLPAFCGGEQIVLVLSRSVPPLLRNKSSISQYSYFVEEMFMRKRKRHPTEKHNYLFSRFCLGLSRGETCVPARARL